MLIMMTREIAYVALLNIRMEEDAMHTVCTYS